MKHLEADLKYLSNVFHALDLPAPPVLEHLRVLAALGRDEAVTHLTQKTVAGKKTGHGKSMKRCSRRRFWFWSLGFGLYS